MAISAGLLAGDVLNFVNQNGISGSYNAGTGVLTLTGTASLANYQAALESITYSTTNSNPLNSGTDLSRTVSWTVNDGTLSSTTITSTVTVSAPPVLSGGGNSVTYTELGGAVVVDSGLGIGDVESATLAGATVAISAGFFAGDTLNFVNQSGISGSYNAGTGVLTLTGSASLANYQAALDSVTFSSTNGNPSNSATDPSRTISWTVNDGILPSNTITSTVAVPLITDMILRDSTNGNYEIYDIANNAILAQFPLGQFALQSQVAGVGGFFSTDTSDMLLRDSISGAFTVYDVSNNTVTSSAAMGEVGAEWTVSGFGEFSSTPGETDMMMEAGSGPYTGVYLIFDIGNNALTYFTDLGQVGPEWSVAGFGDFSGHANETDMLMRDSLTGEFELFDIGHNTVTASVRIGEVGLTWTVAGFGDFSGKAGETDMLMRNTNTGAFEYYDFANNTIAKSGALALTYPAGTAASDWTVAGFGDFSGNANETDMLLRNSNTGAFEVYDIIHNAITSMASLGTIPLEWQVGGIAADPPAIAASAASTALLVQTMAGFGASASVNSAASAVPSGAEAAQQPVLTAPH